MISVYNAPHPILIIVRGLPGSGKSYLASYLRGELGGDSVVMLDPDATDYDSQAYQEHTKQLTQEGVDPKLHAYRFLRAQAYQGITDHRIIIWNQPFTNLEIFHKMTANLEAYATEHDSRLPILVVEVTVDPAVARERVEKRKQQGGHGPSETTFNRFVSDYQSFANEGYHTVSVDGDGDVIQSVGRIIAALTEI